MLSEKIGLLCVAKTRRAGFATVKKLHCCRIMRPSSILNTTRARFGLVEAHQGELLELSERH